MALDVIREAHTLFSSCASFVSECSNRVDSFVGQSIWLFSTCDISVNFALTLGALVILITFAMIPRSYWKSSSPAHSPDSSAPSSLAKEYKSENGQLEKPTRRSRKFWWIVLAIATVLLALILSLSLRLTVGRQHHGGTNSSARSTIVDLGYSSYRGNTYGGVRQWLGIRYAASPTGDLRFAAPQDPIANSTLQNAVTVCMEILRSLINAHCCESMAQPV